MQVKRAVVELGRLLQRAGPYVVLEIVLPGGTLFALLLYLYRSGQLRQLMNPRAVGRGVLRAGSRAFDQLALAVQPPTGIH
jgi:hypothetical protein